MIPEIWQFAGFIAVVGVAFVLWLAAIYLPRRTMEHRYDSTDEGRREKPPETQADATCPDAASRSGSDPTR